MNKVVMYFKTMAYGSFT